MGVGSGECHPWFGRKHKEESRQNMSKNRKGDNHWTHKLGNKKHPRQGTHLDESIKRKISISHLGENNPMFGKHLSEDQKHSRSEKMIGENNPMFGKKLTEKHKNKISLSNKGRKRSLEFKKYQEKYNYKILDQNNKIVDFLLFSDFCKKIGGNSLNITWKNNFTIYKSYKIFRSLK